MQKTIRGAQRRLKEARRPTRYTDHGNSYGEKPDSHRPLAQRVTGDHGDAVVTMFVGCWVLGFSWRKKKEE